MAANSAQKALSTTPSQLPNNPCNECTVNNDDASINMLVGHVAGTQLFLVKPGGTTGPMQVRNTNQVWLKSASGTPTVSYRYS